MKKHRPICRVAAQLKRLRTKVGWKYSIAYLLWYKFKGYIMEFILPQEFICWTHGAGQNIGQCFLPSFARWDTFLNISEHFSFVFCLRSKHTKINLFLYILYECLAPGESWDEYTHFTGRMLYQAKPAGGHTLFMFHSGKSDAKMSTANQSSPPAWLGRLFRGGNSFVH